MQILKEKIKQKAKTLGFDVVGFTKPDVDEDTKKKFKEFLENNCHGEMKWLEKTKFLN